MGELSAAHKAQLAAHNNADLYASVFQAHGLRFWRDGTSFVSPDEPPSYYAKLVTLDPAASVAQMTQISQLAEDGDPISAVKDSFCQLDASAVGMRVLFQAHWIWREPAAEVMQSGSLSGPLVALPKGWSRVRCERDLFEWHDAWRRGGSPTDETIFPTACLQDEALTFLARRSAGRIDAGCVANFSDRTIGLSNVFSTSLDDYVFAKAADAVAAIAGKRPILGYERGDNLHAAEAAGFERLAPLRVLI
ncbi:MAG: hypothetical protein AAF737_04585 [Pseudomonadota bacterium]